MSPTPKKTKHRESISFVENQFEKADSENDSQVQYESMADNQKSAATSEVDHPLPLQIDKTPETARQGRKVQHYNIQTSVEPQRLMFS